MIRLEDAKELKFGQILYEVTARNADGSPRRWRVNGKVKRWKTQPDRIRVPLKWGLRVGSYLSHNDSTYPCCFRLEDFCLTEEEITCPEAEKGREQWRVRIRNMAQITWEVIAMDILVDSHGNPDYSMNISREEVVEIVCDADHMLTFGQDREAYQVWKSLSFEERHEIVASAFPSDCYGW